MRHPTARAPGFQIQSNEIVINYTTQVIDVLQKA